MPTHLDLELDNIKSKMFEMVDLSIEAITQAVESLKTSDVAGARKVVEQDNVLDQIEKDIDNECIRILVTRQPAAIHLRLVLAMLKINTDLERIGDLACNVAKETIRLDGKPTMKALIDIPHMADLCIEMIRESFQSISEKNVEQAIEVIGKDRAIDDLNIQIYRELFSFMAENPNTLSESLGLIMVAKALERIGDHATNIAERAIYYIEGVDVRHTDVEDALK